MGTRLKQLVIFTIILSTCFILSYGKESKVPSEIRKRIEKAVETKETYDSDRGLEWYQSFSFIHIRRLPLMIEMADSINNCDYKGAFGLFGDLTSKGFFYHMIVKDKKSPNYKKFSDIGKGHHESVDSLSRGYKEIFFIGDFLLDKKSIFCFAEGGLLFTTRQWYADLFTFNYKKKVFLPDEFGMDGMTLVWKFTCMDGVIQGAEVMLYSPWEECYGIYDLKKKTYTKFKER